METQSYPLSTSLRPHSQERAIWITRQARQLFSAYRRDDYADPDGFVLQLGVILEKYPDSVIEQICSPFSGIQRKSTRPPNIADIVIACDLEKERQDKLRNPFHFTARAPRPPAETLANVLVLHEHPRFEEMAQRTKTANRREWREDADGRGVWVALGWLSERKATGHS
jgi:hypothetical protein